MTNRNTTNITKTTKTDYFQPRGQGKTLKQLIDNDWIPWEKSNPFVYIKRLIIGIRRLKDY